MCCFLLRGGVTLLASPYYLLASCISHTTGLKVKQLFEFFNSVARTSPSKTYPIVPHDDFTLFRTFLKFGVTVWQKTICFVVGKAKNIK